MIWTPAKKVLSKTGWREINPPVDGMPGERSHAESYWWCILEEIPLEFRKPKVVFSTDQVNGKDASVQLLDPYKNSRIQSF